MGYAYYDESGTLIGWCDANLDLPDIADVDADGNPINIIGIRYKAAMSYDEYIALAG